MQLASSSYDSGLSSPPKTRSRQVMQTGFVALQQQTSNCCVDVGEAVGAYKIAIATILGVHLDPILILAERLAFSAKEADQLVEASRYSHQSCHQHSQAPPGDRQRANAQFPFLHRRTCTTFLLLPCIIRDSRAWRRSESACSPESFQRRTAESASVSQSKYQFAKRCGYKYRKGRESNV